MFNSKTLTHLCFFFFLCVNRLVHAWRRTEGSLPTDDPWPSVAVYYPVICFRLRLDVVQPLPVSLLLFILSALMRQESSLDHWKSLRISRCVARRHTFSLRWMNVHLKHWRDLIGNKAKQNTIGRQTHTLQIPIQDETGGRHSSLAHNSTHSLQRPRRIISRTRHNSHFWCLHVLIHVDAHTF